MALTVVAMPAKKQPETEFGKRLVAIRQARQT